MVINLILVLIVVGLLNFLEFKKFGELKICLQTGCLLSLTLCKLSVVWFRLCILEFLIIGLICYIISKINITNESDENLKRDLDKLETQLMLEEMNKKELQKEINDLRLIVNEGYVSLAYELSKAINVSKDKPDPDLETINILTKIHKKVRRSYDPKPLVVIPKESFKYRFDLWLAKRDLVYIKKNMKYGSTFESYIDACLEDIKRKENKK